MENKKTKQKCKSLRTWLLSELSRRFSLDSDWIQKHIANCPKCQKRLANASRVNLALALIKAQPHKIDLLMHANQKAVAVLKHSLRYSRKSELLKSAVPKPKFIERFGKYTGSIANVAACFAILLLLKIGVFNSVGKFQAEGENALKHYYASQVGDDIANDIFSA